MTSSSRFAGHERVADDVGVLVRLVRPGAAGVRAGGGVELVDRPAALVGVVDERALDDRVQVPAVARPGHRLEAAARPHVGVSPGCRYGFCGDFPPANGTGAASSLPAASTCSRNGPNSSPIQKVPSLARTTDSMSKSAPVSSRSGGVVVDDREVDPAVRVAQRDELARPRSRRRRRPRSPSRASRGRAAAGSRRSWPWCRTRCPAAPRTCRRRCRPCPRSRGSPGPANGPWRPLAGVASAPDGGPGARKSADSVARATRVGWTTCCGPRSPPRRRGDGGEQRDGQVAARTESAAVRLMPPANSRPATVADVTDTPGWPAREPPVTRRRPCVRAMRLGVLDVGSNTVHLLVVDARRGGPPSPSRRTGGPSPDAVPHPDGRDQPRSASTRSSPPWPTPSQPGRPPVDELLRSPRRPCARPRTAPGLLPSSSGRPGSGCRSSPATTSAADVLHGPALVRLVGRGDPARRHRRGVAGAPRRGAGVPTWPCHSPGRGAVDGDLCERPPPPGRSRAPAARAERLQEGRPRFAARPDPPTSSVVQDDPLARPVGRVTRGRVGPPDRRLLRRAEPEDSVPRLAHNPADARPALPGISNTSCSVASSTHRIAVPRGSEARVPVQRPWKTCSTPRPGRRSRARRRRRPPPAPSRTSLARFSSSVAPSPRTARRAHPGRALQGGSLDPGVVRDHGRSSAAARRPSPARSRDRSRRPRAAASRLRTPTPLGCEQRPELSCLVRVARREHEPHRRRGRGRAARRPRRRSRAPSPARR